MTVLNKLDKFFVLFSTLFVLALFAVYSFSDSIQAQTSPDLLTWEPPQLENPVVNNISGPGTISLATNTDYIIKFPSTPVNGPVAINGGRNVIIVGGEVSIPWQGNNASINSRRALYIVNSTGTVHVEGLVMRGEDISEGIQINAPLATVQVQNVRIEDIHARDQVGFSDNHPDCIQTWGSVGELHVDKFTCSTDYQGLFLSADYNRPHGSVTIKRTNIFGTPTARYLFWVMNSSFDSSKTVTLNDVWVDIPFERESSFGFGKSVWPDTDGTYPRQAQISVDENNNQFATWPLEMIPLVNGRVTEGTPLSGDFVPAGSVGIGYTSPGYVNQPNPSPTVTPEPTQTATPTPAPYGDPTISITSPVNGSSVSRNSTVTLSADTTDTLRVSFQVVPTSGKGDSYSCTDTVAPFSCSWPVPGKPGTQYTVTATAEGYNSNTASSVVTVTSSR